MSIIAVLATWVIDHLVTVQ